MQFLVKMSHAGPFICVLPCLYCGRWLAVFSLLWGVTLKSNERLESRPENIMMTSKLKSNNLSRHSEMWESMKQRGSMWTRGCRFASLPPHVLRLRCSSLLFDLLTISLPFLCRLPAGEQVFAFIVQVHSLPQKQETFSCLFGCRTEENVVPKGSFLMFQPTRSSSDKHPSEHKLCNILNKTECSVDIMHDKTQIYALHRYYIIDNLHLMKKIFAEKVRYARLCMLYIIYELFFVAYSIFVLCRGI